MTRLSKERMEIFKSKKQEYEKNYRYIQIDKESEKEEEKKHRGEILKLADFTNVFLWSADYFLTELSACEQENAELKNKLTVAAVALEKYQTPEHQTKTEVG